MASNSKDSYRELTRRVSQLSRRRAPRVARHWPGYSVGQASPRNFVVHRAGADNMIRRSNVHVTNPGDQQSWVWLRLIAVRPHRGEEMVP
jgi:hypothetical protein